MSTNATPTGTSAQPYIFFNGKTEEALEFYQKAVGAKVEMLMRFNQSPVPCDPNMVPPGTEHKVMHCTFTIGPSTLHASDGGCSEGAKPEFQGFSLSLSVPTAAEADKAFAALSEGGEIRMPLGETFFSPRFGMLQDKFGLGWMIIVPRPMP